jgi:hypothetical protein
MKILNTKFLLLTILSLAACFVSFTDTARGQTIPLRTCTGVNPAVKQAKIELTKLGDINFIACSGRTVLLNGSLLNGSGTVQSVGLSMPGIFTVSGSPVTNSGTLSATLASQTANLVLASPNGAPGSPLFRSIVNADITSLDGSKIISGTVPIARLATGTPTSSNFVRGDGTFATPQTGMIPQGIVAGSNINLTTAQSGATVYSNNLFSLTTPIGAAGLIYKFVAGAGTYVYLSGTGTVSVYRRSSATPTVGGNSGYVFCNMPANSSFTAVAVNASSWILTDEAGAAFTCI